MNDLEAEASRIAHDFGVRVTLRRSSETLDPESQQIVVTSTDHETVALLGGENLVLGANRDYGLIGRELWLRSSELPGGLVQLTDRVLSGTEEYEIVEASRSADGVWWRTLVRKRGTLSA